MSPDFLRGEWGRILLMGLQRVMEGPREVPCSVWESAMSPSLSPIQVSVLGIIQEVVSPQVSAAVWVWQSLLHTFEGLTWGVHI